MREYKLAVLGSGGVGKSALTSQYVHGIFPQCYDPTIEDSYRKQAVIDDRNCSLEILDTAGIEQFTAMRELYISNSEGFVLVYSVTDRRSFEELKPLHEQIVRLKDNLNVPIVLVGNKCDLQSKRQVHFNEAQLLAREWGRIPFYEASAKEYFNVEEAFTSLVRQMAKRDSAIGSSLRNPSISGSFDSVQTRIRHKKSGPMLAVKRSMARMRERRSMRRLTSVMSFHQAEPNGTVKYSNSQYPMGRDTNPLSQAPDIPYAETPKAERSSKRCVIM